MIVDAGVLPGLVRATAVNASRAKRAMMSHYQTYYEDRAKALDSIIEKFKQPSTFEDFVASVYSPSPLSCLLPGSRGGSRSSRSELSPLLEPVLGEDRRWGEEPGRPRAHTEHEPHHAPLRQRHSVGALQQPQLHQVTGGGAGVTTSPPGAVRD